MADPFQFELVSPERLLMSEPVDQVVVPGSEGYFTVLKGHAPFMSTLRPGVVDIIRGSGTDARLRPRRLRRRQRQTASPSSPRWRSRVADIDAAQLAQEVKNAEEDVADAKDGATRDAAETRLAQLREVQAALTG